MCCSPHAAARRCIISFMLMPPVLHLSAAIALYCMHAAAISVGGMTRQQLNHHLSDER